ncbi:MAG: sugar nucleotide-binding protein, partial [Parcubacteria group bacterium]|nr:sugar nucleotide-binding protein [Parcubacteria group bacterium]
ARRPDIIFHLAAETDVDKCQSNREHAFETNARGTENMAVICRELDIPLVYVSTGAVFDGEKMTGYIEEDATNPANIYGESSKKNVDDITLSDEPVFVEKF